MSDPALLPSYYAGILFQSRMQPHALAVIHGPRRLTFRNFCEHIEGVTRRLHSAAIPAGSRVGVQVQDGYLRWLAVIALARLGLVCVSLSGAAAELDFVRADVVILDGPAVPGRRCIRIEEEWYTAHLDALPPFQDFLHDPAAPCRIVLSSGTTGLPKKALLTYGHLRARSRGTARAYGLNATTRMLTTMGISTVGGFWTPVTVWANGGCVILTQPRANEGWGRILSRSQPNVLFSSTAQLGALIGGLPPDFWPTEPLVAYVAGSALPLALNRLARMRLTQSLYVIYGSTEAGGVTVAHAALADTRPQFTGYVLATAQVEIVDEQGAVVPNGTMGEVRIRADGLVDQYLEDTDAQDGSFRDGWFYPGDAGTLDHEGGLSIVGRTRELMNFGGVKISPDSIETSLGSLPGVSDLAVFSIDVPGKAPKPYVAVVASDDIDEAQLKARYKRAFPTLPPLSVVRVESIPRNEMGKTLRLQIAANVEKAAA